MINPVWRKKKWYKYKREVKPFVEHLRVLSSCNIYILTTGLLSRFWAWPPYIGQLLVKSRPIVQKTVVLLVWPPSYHLFFLSHWLPNDLSVTSLTPTLGLSLQCTLCRYVRLKYLKLGIDLDVKVYVNDKWGWIVIYSWDLFPVLQREICDL